MRIFISFAEEQSDIAESIYRKLLAAGYRAFHSSCDISASDAFDERIRREVLTADRLVFLASRDSLAEGAFTHTELRAFSTKWPDPTGRVIPVLLGDVSPPDLPPYLRSVTSAFRAKGDTASEVVATIVQRWPRPRLGRWAAALACAAALVVLAVVTWPVLVRGREPTPGPHDTAPSMERQSPELPPGEGGEPSQPGPTAQQDAKLPEATTEDANAPELHGPPVRNVEQVHDRLPADDQSRSVARGPAVPSKPQTTGVDAEPGSTGSDASLVEPDPAAVDESTLERVPTQSAEVANDDVEPNDSFGSATVVHSRCSVNGRIGFERDAQDWFAIRTPEDGSLKIQVSNSSQKGTANANIKPLAIRSESDQQLAYRGQVLRPGGVWRPQAVNVSANSLTYVRIVAPAGNRVAYDLSCLFSPLP